MDTDSHCAEDELPAALPARADGKGRDPWLRQDDGFSVTLPIGSSLFDIEREFILATLEHFDGDKRRAASVLGCSVKTLYNKLHLYRLQSAHDAPADRV
jgi:DNA-binding NtrC family response regulator